MLKKLPFLYLFVFVFFIAALPIHAQTATGSGSATDSATASDSGVVLDSGSASGSASSSSLPETLPETGAADVFILTAAGLIFLLAGVTLTVGTQQVFSEIE